MPAVACAAHTSGCAHTRDLESSRVERRNRRQSLGQTSRTSLVGALSGLRTPPPRLTARLTTSLASPTLMLCMSRATDACLLATIEPAARRRRGARTRMAVEATQVALRQEEQRSPWYMIAQDCRLRVHQVALAVPCARHPLCNDARRAATRAGLPAPVVRNDWPAPAGGAEHDAP